MSAQTEKRSSLLGPGGATGLGFGPRRNSNASMAPGVSKSRMSVSWGRGGTSRMSLAQRRASMAGSVLSVGSVAGFARRGSVAPADFMPKSSKTKVKEEIRMRSRIKVHPPEGILGAHVKQLRLGNWNPLHMFDRFEISVYVRIHVNGSCKWTSAYEYVTFPSFLIFDDLKNFKVEVSDRRDDESNIITIELVGFDRPDVHRIIAKQTMHMYTIIKQLYQVQTYKMTRLDKPVGELEMEFCFAYGELGYGFSNQLENRQIQPKTSVGHSMFPRFEPPDERKGGNIAQDVMTCTPIGHPSYIPFTQKAEIGDVALQYGSELELLGARQMNTPSLTIMKIRKKMMNMLREMNGKTTRKSRIAYLRNIVYNTHLTEDQAGEEILIPRDFHLRRRTLAGRAERYEQMFSGDRDSDAIFDGLDDIDLDAPIPGINMPPVPPGIDLSHLVDMGNLPGVLPVPAPPNTVPVPVVHQRPSISIQKESSSEDEEDNETTKGAAASKWGMTTKLMRFFGKFIKSENAVEPEPEPEKEEADEPEQRREDESEEDYEQRLIQQRHYAMRKKRQETGQWRQSIHGDYTAEVTTIMEEGEDDADEEEKRRAKEERRRERQARREKRAEKLREGAKLTDEDKLKKETELAREVLTKMTKMKEMKRRLAENKAQVAPKGQQPVPSAASETQAATLEDELKERQIDHKLWKIIHLWKKQDRRDSLMVPDMNREKLDKRPEGETSATSLATVGGSAGPPGPSSTNLAPEPTGSGRRKSMWDRAMGAMDSVLLAQPKRENIKLVIPRVMITPPTPDDSSDDDFTTSDESD